MSAQIIQVACSWCKGSGRAETLLEKTVDGDWVPNKMLDHDLADAWIAGDKNPPIRWQECDCPICGGVGNYEVESIPVKIF